jgi:hypothetical protein
VCDLETSRICTPYIYIYIYDISHLRVNHYHPTQLQWPIYASYSSFELGYLLLRDRGMSASTFILPNAPFLSSSFPSALQSLVSLGVLNSQSPLFSVFRLLCPLLYLHYFQGCYNVIPSISNEVFLSFIL